MRLKNVTPEKAKDKKKTEDDVIVQAILDVSYDEAGTIVDDFSNKEILTALIRIVKLR